MGPFVIFVHFLFCERNETTAVLSGGGVKKIESRKLEWDKQSKVGSTNNINHKPGGGNVKVSILKRQPTRWKCFKGQNDEFITFCVCADGF
jgi:hypothetical protein